MSLATQTAPQFRVDEWVTYLQGYRRILAQVIEDRGRLGIRGGRLYRLRIEGEGDEATTTVVPENLLEPAPEILPASVATERNFTTQNWPRQAFDFFYCRPADKDLWTVLPKTRERIGIGNARGAVAYSTARRGSEAAGSELHAFVSVLLEYDPRLSDPRSSDLWESMTEEARVLADELFKSRHPKAWIQP